VAKTDEHGTVRVRITSVDGNVDHPFRREQAVGEVHQWAYERLVRDKDQVKFDATWLEYGGQRQDDSKLLKAFDLSEEHQPGREIDLTVNLAWTSQGGSCWVR